MHHDSAGLFIRADASPTIGTGHAMRCLALAQAARSIGMPVRLAAHIDVPWVLDKLKPEKLSFLELQGSALKQERPEELLAQIEGTPTITWVVLDGYHFGLDCQQAVRAAGYKLLVIDDYAHLPEYSCDILLNQNFGAESLQYSGDMGKKLLGPQYALLRQEFSESRTLAENRELAERPRIFLLSLGGGDFLTHLERVAPDFFISELSGCTLRVIAGVVPPERIRYLLRDCPAKIEILNCVDDMPSLLLDTDLCVTAGGSTCWELCCLGVPFLTLEVAENQRHTVNMLAKKEIASAFTRNSLQAFWKKNKLADARTILFNVTKGDGGEKALQHLMTA